MKGAVPLGIFAQQYTTLAQRETTNFKGAICGFVSSTREYIYIYIKRMYSNAVWDDDANFFVPGVISRPGAH